MQSAADTSSKAASKPKNAQLLRLPVPELQDTLNQYLTSLEPFLLEDEANSGDLFRTTWARQKNLADEFVKEEGNVLQQRLKVLDHCSPHNWLDDNIWLKIYHHWRVPLLVNSNWWAAWPYDPSVPEDVVLGKGSDQIIANTGVTRWQVRRAAWLAHRLLDFKLKVDRQELAPDTTAQGSWFREMFGRTHHSSRVPMATCDMLAPKSCPQSLAARSFLLSICDWFYLIEALDEDMNQISVKELEDRIAGAVVDAAQRGERGEVAIPIGVLTADDRDTWAENFAHLLSLSPENAKTLTAINNSLCGIALDGYTYGLDDPSFELDTPEEVDKHMQYARSSHPDRTAHNRWYDKTFTILLESNSRASVMGEHSPVDAIVPSVCGQYALMVPVDEDAFGSSLEDSPFTSASSGWTRLDWVVDDRIRQECVSAEERAKAVADDSDNSVLHFDAYGRDFMKELGVSADAYVQMALQLSYHRIQKSFAATYETALLHKFARGRTEAIRVLTTDSRAWVLAMADPESTAQTRSKLLMKAMDTHTKHTRMAANGSGIDRHLLGLRLMTGSWSDNLPELMSDEIFMRSQTWKLSTSSLGTGLISRGTGFGALEQDGYGVCYFFDADSITFGIESKHSCEDTSTKRFKNFLRESLDEMQQLCTVMPPAKANSADAIRTHL